MNVFEAGLLKYFSQSQFDRIRAVCVGIAGLGGLGSHCAVALVRCGFRQLVLVDFDNVEASNLNRQFYFLAQVGWPKTEALAENLMRINPDLDLKLYQRKVTPQNAAQIFVSCAVVVEAFDSPEEKRMLVQEFLGSEKLLVSASGLAGWGDADSIKTEKIKERFYLIGDGAREASLALPPCAPRVTVAAAKQADVVLAWVLEGFSYNVSC